MGKRRSAVIAYDITSNKRRRRVFNCLQSWSLDTQYSLFECLLTKAEATELFLQLTELIDTDEDSLLLAWLDPARSTENLHKGQHTGFQIPALYAG